jgi:antitoxin HigA-1
MADPPAPRSRIGYRLVHPGEILLNEFLEPFEISQNMLARMLGVSPRRINEIVLGKRAITADTAIGLAEALGPSEHFWMGLQSDYELEMARERRAVRPPPHRPESPEHPLCDYDIDETWRTHEWPTWPRK